MKPPAAPRDTTRIDLRDTRYWCAKWHCTEYQLREAVDQVGDMASNVESYLVQRAVSTAFDETRRPRRLS